MNNNYFYPFNNYFNLNEENTNLNLYGPYEGYLKGNLFKNLYEEYKKYKPVSLSFSTEKEEKLFNINQICFAMHELNLLLDIYPNDKNIIKKYVDYQNIEATLQKEYEEEYGPLNTSSINNTTPFEWVNTPFPWEVN